jgi:hypothetical protein
LYEEMTSESPSTVHRVTGLNEGGRRPRTTSTKKGSETRIARSVPGLEQPGAYL